MGHLAVHLFVVLSPYVSENSEQSSVQILVVASDAKVPSGHVRTQNFVAVSAYDSGSDGHVPTHIWVLLSRIWPPEQSFLHLSSVVSAHSSCLMGHVKTQVLVWVSSYVCFPFLNPHAATHFWLINYPNRSSEAGHVETQVFSVSYPNESGSEGHRVTQYFEIGSAQLLALQLIGKTHCLVSFLAKYPVGHTFMQVLFPKYPKVSSVAVGHSFTHDRVKLSANWVVLHVGEHVLSVSYA